MVCEMTINPNGELAEHQFYEAVMNSKARLTYTKVWDLLKEEGQANPELHKRYAEQVPHLKNLHDMYRTLKRRRNKRGAIEFETQESKFVFNAQRKIDTIVPVTRNDAHKLIEECMILANVAAAKTLSKQKAEALYRIHDEPDSDRLSAFLSYLAEVGITHHISKDASPQEFTEVISKIQGRADQELIQTMLLRSMKQAVYSHENIGHFGLALDAYAHFTSPIRRYPDLVVHRALKATIDKKQQQKSKTGGKAYTEEEVDALGEQCSMTERRADDATRDVSDWLKCEFMLDHVGDTFDGVIASVTSFGFFVRLTEFHIDGLVHISALDNDFYQFDETKQHLVGENSGIVYRLGDPLEVKVAGVNLDERKIDFVLANAPPKPKGGRRGAKKSTSSKKGSAKNTSGKESPVSKAGAKAASDSDKTGANKKKPRTRRSSNKGGTASKPASKPRRSSSNKRKK